MRAASRQEGGKAGGKGLFQRGSLGNGESKVKLSFMEKDGIKRYRSPASLWRVIRQLPEGTVRVIRRRLKETRLGWLFEALREMNAYDKNRIEELFQREFPETKASILRVYKKQLWDVIEEVLAAEVESHEGGWQAYRRMLASFRLWLMGEYETAFVLWQQAMEQAIEAEAYEVALRGLLWLELYMRDLHWISPRSHAISEWLRAILEIIERRYQALTQKIAALESYIPTRKKRSGLVMPSLPVEDRWSIYFNSYAQLLSQAVQANFLEAVESNVRMLRVILSRGLHTIYDAFQFFVNYLNLLIILLNYRERSWFDVFYELWEEARQKGFYPEEARFEALGRLVLAVRLARYIQEGKWSLAYDFLRKHDPDLRLLVFHSLENIGLRLGVGVSICWLAFQHGDKKLYQAWMAGLEEWIRQEGLDRETERLWYELLLWYMAHVEGYVRIARYQVYRLLTLWKTHHTHDNRFRKLILIIKLITNGKAQRASHLARILLEKYKDSWQADESTFPILSFLQAVSRGSRLHPLSPQPDNTQELPPPLQAELKNIAHAFKLYMRSRSDKNSRQSDT